MVIVHILRAALRIVLAIIGSMEVIGAENIPQGSNYILTVNHMSKADPPLIFLAMPPLRMRFFAGEKWEKHIIFGPLMRMVGAVYVNRGEVDRRALREAIGAIKAGSIFGLAPEGTRSRSASLMRGRDGAAYLATRADAPVLPVAITNTDMVGSNLKRFRRTRMTVEFGEPLQMPTVPRRPRSAQLAAYTHLIMIHIASMLPERYWGAYADSPALGKLLKGDDPWPACWFAEGLVYPGHDEQAILDAEAR